MCPMRATPDRALCDWSSSCIRARQRATDSLHQQGAPRRRGIARPVAWQAAKEQRHRVHGATAARLTPDQKVRSSNLSALISCELLRADDLAQAVAALPNSQGLGSNARGRQDQNIHTKINKDAAKTKFHLAKKIFKS